MEGRTDGLLGGRYRLIERLGEGGMSVVWRGYDELLNRQVAVKVLASRHAADPTFRRRIRVEAQAAAKLSSPYMADVYDYGETPSTHDATMVPYVVMELVDGPSLASQLSGRRSLPWRVTVTIAAQVASALAAAHARGVVHRDVTPGNIMLSADGPKVVDFGISALAGDRDADAEGNILGTPAYLAPERIKGQPVLPATDVYALGLLLYRALTGRLPWDADTVTQMVKAHCYSEPSALPPVDGLPDGIASLSQRCLAKDPAGRPSSAQLASELWDALDGRPERFVPPVPAIEEDPECVAALSTSVLALATNPLSTWSGATTRPAPAASGRVRLGLAGIAVVLTMIGIWAGTNWSDDGHPVLASEPTTLSAGAGPRPAECVVEYRLHRQTKDAFAAAIAVRNSGTVPIASWELTFDLPGEQRMVGGTGAVWSQRGQSLSARATNGTALVSGGQARLTLSARYRGTNPMPVAFQVNGSECAAVLLGSAAVTAGRPEPRHENDDDNSGPGGGGDDDDKGKGKKDD